MECHCLMFCWGWKANHHLSNSRSLPPLLKNTLPWSVYLHLNTCSHTHAYVESYTSFQFSPSIRVVGLRWRRRVQRTRWLLWVVWGQKIFGNLSSSISSVRDCMVCQWLWWRRGTTSENTFSSITWEQSRCRCRVQQESGWGQEPSRGWKGRESMESTSLWSRGQDLEVRITIAEFRAICTNLRCFRFWLGACDFHLRGPLFLWLCWWFSKIQQWLCTRQDYGHCQVPKVQSWANAQCRRLQDECMALGKYPSCDLLQNLEQRSLREAHQSWNSMFRLEFRGSLLQ